MQMNDTPYETNILYNTAKSCMNGQKLIEDFCLLLYELYQIFERKRLF